MKEGFGPPPIEVRHVSNTNRYRAPDGADEAAFRDRLLAEIEAVIEEEGPDTIALFIAEPIQNAGGSLVPPAGYWQGLREICDRHGILLMADEVISGCGRIGEWFAVAREGVAPDLVSMAKGLTSAYAPMGAVMVGDRVAEPLYDAKRLLRHGITFAGHPLAASIALKNIEIFERDGVLENVRALEGHLRDRLEELRALPIVGDVRGAGFFWAVEMVRDADGTRFDDEERERLIRGFIPKRLLEAGIIARPDDRGDSVLQIAPPLIADAGVLDAIVDGLADVLADAGEHMGVGRQAATA
jgi:adenosylmethionine-8-amino-7-oxononanoate aminotransferase